MQSQGSLLSLARHSAAPARRNAYTMRQRQRGTPCSYPQEMLIFNNELDPFDPSHNESFWMSMEGELNLHAMCLALRNLCKRHTVLQSRFSISVRTHQASIWDGTAAAMHNYHQHTRRMHSQRAGGYLLSRPASVLTWPLLVILEPRVGLDRSVCLGFHVMLPWGRHPVLTWIHAGSGCAVEAASAAQVRPPTFLHRSGHWTGAALASLSTALASATPCNGSSSLRRFLHLLSCAPSCKACHSCIDWMKVGSCECWAVTKCWAVTMHTLALLRRPCLAYKSCVCPGPPCKYDPRQQGSDAFLHNKREHLRREISTQAWLHSLQDEHNVMYLTSEAAQKIHSQLQHLADEDGHAAPHSLRTWLQYAPLSASTP